MWLKVKSDEYVNFGAGPLLRVSFEPGHTYRSSGDTSVTVKEQVGEKATLSWAFQRGPNLDGPYLTTYTGEAAASIRAFLEENAWHSPPAGK